MDQADVIETVATVLGVPTSAITHQSLTEEGGMVCSLQRIFVTSDSGDKSAIQSGMLFGPGSPNNWAKKDQLDKITENFLKGRSLEIYIEQTFRTLAKIHAKCWKKSELLSHDWLRGYDWWSQTGESTWTASQQMISDRWKRAKEAMDENGQQDNGVQWDKDFISIIDASVKKISFSDYQQFTKTTAWTFVTGDCHPANFMWIPDIEPKDAIKLFDFEMVAVGSGPQDIAQYFISHVDPKLRREIEKKLVEVYYSELVENGVKDYSRETCWSDYVKGGSERWVWFVSYMSVDTPKEICEYFNSQTYAFCKDHNVTPQNVNQPRT